MKYEKAKLLIGRRVDEVLSRRFMDSRGAYSDKHEAQTAGYAPCRHNKYAHPGFDYVAVRTSVYRNGSSNYAHYSLWARKGETR